MEAHHSDAQKELAFKKHIETGCNGGNCNLFKQCNCGVFRHFTREEFFAEKWTVGAWLKYPEQ